MTYDAASNTAVIGTGLVFDTVYQRLLDYGVTVVGGRVTGVSCAAIASAVVFLPPCNRSAWAAFYSVAVGL